MAAGVEPLLILWSSLLIGWGGPHLSSTSCVKAFPCIYSVSWKVTLPLEGRDLFKCFCFVFVFLIP